MPRFMDMGALLQRRRLLQVALALPTLRVAGAVAQSGDAAATRIRRFYDALLVAMKQAQRLGVRGRYEMLATPVRETLDLAAMTRIAVGPQWNALGADERTALVDAFSRMTIATYANRFDGFSGERFEVQPESEERSTGRVVRTRLVQSNGEPVVLDYLMRGSGDDWKVVDVYLTGTISELATRRAEFAKILKSGGAAAVVQSLNAQADQLLRAPEPRS
jgi:phospholipid transport system substrate-binding protein